MLAPSWRVDAAQAYLNTLQDRSMVLEARDGRLIIPAGHTPAELALCRMLKPELLRLLSRDVTNLREGVVPICEP